MNTLRKVLAFMMLFLCPFLAASCFTGIENTGHISSKDVNKEKANKQIPEKVFFDSISPKSFSHWYKGKEFYVADNNIKMVLTPSVDSLKGKVLKYEGLTTIRQIDNTDEAVILLSDGISVFNYKSGKDSLSLVESTTENIVPFLIDIDYVMAVDSALRGRTLSIKTSSWKNRDGSADIGVKYVKVQIDSVMTGDAIYPLYVKFHYKNRPSGIFVSSPFSSVGNMAFDKLFSFQDIRSLYKSISDEVWALIVAGKLQKGMTKEECLLSLGNPRTIDRTPTYGGLVERWVYDNGVFLTFADGLLDNYRQ